MSFHIQIQKLHHERNERGFRGCRTALRPGRSRLGFSLRRLKRTVLRTKVRTIHVTDYLHNGSQHSRSVSSWPKVSRLGARVLSQDDTYGALLCHDGACDC